MSSPEEKLIATRINDSDEHFIEHEQCVSVCCQKYPDYCKHVNKPKLVDSSTQTIDLVAHDHNYWCSVKTRNVSTQHTSPEFGIDSIKTDSDARFYTGLSLSVFFDINFTIVKLWKRFAI